MSGKRSQENYKIAIRKAPQRALIFIKIAAIITPQIRRRCPRVFVLQRATANAVRYDYNHTKEN